MKRADETKLPTLGGRGRAKERSACPRPRDDVRGDRPCSRPRTIRQQRQAIMNADVAKCMIHMCSMPLPLRPRPSGKTFWIFGILQVARERSPGPASSIGLSRPMDAPEGVVEPMIQVRLKRSAASVYMDSLILRPRRFPREDTMRTCEPHTTLRNIVPQPVLMLPLLLR